MLRLIDIVLILLFGFISISHIDRAVEVELPQAEFLPRVVPDFENWSVLAVDGQGNWICGFDRLEATGRKELGDWLVSEKAAGATHVRLRVNRERPSGEIALVQDLCEELDMALALEVLLDSQVKP